MDTGDKHRSKSGRYVGGFLQLLDWNAKSRKKLFSSKSYLPEDLKQGKKAMGSLPMTRIRVDEDEDFGIFGEGMSVRGGSDYSCASSVTDEDGYGTKAPGVVARLMGLDSLPTTNVMEPYSTPYFDSISVREAPFRGRNMDLYHDHQITHSSHLYGKMESTTRNKELESRSLKMPNRPIEKFQTEILPPKSAKTIPITHHKLLSPIKSPIFVPSQDAAYIMEAASRIIEPGPSATPRSKISSLGSSSLPLKVREMRERLEAAQRPAKVSEPLQRSIESNAAKHVRKHSMNKSWNELGETTLYGASPSREDSSVALKNKGKSISLAIQAKVNVQKREKGLTSSNRSVGDLEEKDGNKSTRLSRNQTSAPKFSNRKPQNQNNSVLRQNNQKQNCPSPHGERSDIKASDTSNTTGKKPISEDTSNSRPKSVIKEPGTSRTSSRKSSLHARDSDKGLPYGGGKNVPRKKRSVDGSLQFKKNQVTENMLITSKHGNPSQSSASANKQVSWVEESRRKGLDVVSFTFAAPINRSQNGFEPSRQLAEKCSSDEGSKMFSDSDLTWLSSPGLNGIKGDALSKLLEQKLKELASNLESSDSTFVKSGIATGSEQAVASGSIETGTEKSREKLPQEELLAVDMNRNIYSGFLANEAEQFERTFNFQAGAAMDKYYSDKAEAKKWNNCHLPSPVSILEPSILTESCCSSESITSCITEESKPCSSVQTQETDISGAVSSTPSQVTTDNSMKSTAWELCYVKDILCNVELMFKDYVAGRTREIVNPQLFDQMERRRDFGNDELKLERKILFDCVGECLDLKCQRFVGGGFDMWIKGIATLKREERLAEEVYKEIQVWRGLENSMVDELVDKDMSSKYGRWLDFEVDEFVLGVEIEGQILDSLVEEIIFDIISKQ